MPPLNQFFWSYLRHQSKIFWALFIALGLFIIFGALGIFILDIVLGFIMVIIGIEKLRDELYSYKNEKEKQTVFESINYINNWMSSNTELTNLLKDKYDTRFLKIDTKHTELNKEVETRYREIVRKLVDMENKLREVDRAMRILAERELSRGEVHTLRTGRTRKTPRLVKRKK